MGAYVYIDHSNLIYGIRNCEECQDSTSVRIKLPDFLGLVEEKYDTILDRAVGKDSPALRSVYRAHGYRNVRHDGLEKCLKTLLGEHDAGDKTIAFVSGAYRSSSGTSYAALFQRLLDIGFKVDVYSWKECLHSMYEDMAVTHENFRVIILNEWWEKIVFYKEQAPISGVLGNPQMHFSPSACHDSSNLQVNFQADQRHFAAHDSSSLQVNMHHHQRQLETLPAPQGVFQRSPHQMYCTRCKSQSIERCETVLCPYTHLNQPCVCVTPVIGGHEEGIHFSSHPTSSQEEHSADEQGPSPTLDDILARHKDGLCIYVDKRLRELTLAHEEQENEVRAAYEERLVVRQHFHENQRKKVSQMNKRDHRSLSHHYLYLLAQRKEQLMAICEQRLAKQATDNAQLLEIRMKAAEKRRDEQAQKILCLERQLLDHGGSSHEKDRSVPDIETTPSSGDT